MASGAGATYAAPLQTPGLGPTASSSVGQTFTTGGECVILSFFTLALVPQASTGRVRINALLYPFDVSTNRVTGPALATQLTSAIEDDSSLSVTFQRPVQLSPATSYAIILTTSGQGQAAEVHTILIRRSPSGNPNEILGGKSIFQGSGDSSAAIETDPFISNIFTPGDENFAISIN